MEILNNRWAQLAVFLIVISAVTGGDSKGLELPVLIAILVITVPAIRKRVGLDRLDSLLRQRPKTNQRRKPVSAARKKPEAGVTANRSLSRECAPNACVKDVVLSRLEGALTKFAEAPPSEAYSQGEGYFTWQIGLRDANGKDLTTATGDEFAVQCDVALLEDVIMNDSGSMEDVFEDIRERFQQFLSDTKESIVLEPADNISLAQSSFYIYVCEVVDGGADVWRYYGEDFMFDELA